MKTGQTKQPQAPRKSAPAPGAPPGVSPAAPALPYEPGVSPNAVDVTGIVPEDVFVDPEITEGHRGYEESGGSEISQRQLGKE